MRIAHAPSQLDRRPRAVAIGTFDGVHLGHRSVIAAAVATGLAPTVVTFDPHPRLALGNRVELLATLERRLELLDEAGVEATIVVAFTPEVMRLEPEAFVDELPARDRRRGRRRGRGLPLRAPAGGRPRAARAPRLPDGRRARGRRRLVVARSALALHEGDLAAAPRMLGRPPELDGVVVTGDQRGGTLGYPTANLQRRPGPARAAVRDLRRLDARPPGGDLDRHEPPLRRRRAPHRAVPARLRRRPLRPAARRRAVGAAPRRGRLRVGGSARRADRAGRRARRAPPSGPSRSDVLEPDRLVERHSASAAPLRRGSPASPVLPTSETPPK